MNEPNIPQVTDEQKAAWKQGGEASTSAIKTPEIVACGLGDYCRTCQANFKKDTWAQEKKYCSKACRQKRHYKNPMTDTIDKEYVEPNGETREAFKPLAVRAWHKPLRAMCIVMAIDYPGQRIYVQIPNRDNYNFNAPMNEFNLMAALGDHYDAFGTQIFEGDLVEVAIVGQEKWVGDALFDRELAELVVRESKENVREGGEPRFIPITPEICKSLAVVGTMFEGRVVSA